MDVSRLARRSLLLAAGILAISTSAQAAPTRYELTVQQDDPAAFWTLQDPSAGPFADATGGAPVTPSGSGLFDTTGPTGAGSRALGFSGAGSVDAGQRFDFAGHEPFTVEAWVRPDEITAGFEALVAKHGYNAGRAGWQLWLTPRGPGCTSACAGTVSFQRWDAGVCECLTGERALTPGWHHIVATYDGSWMALYVDGMLDHRRPTTAASAPTTYDPLYLGAMSPTFGLLHGALSEVALYREALGADRIRAHVRAAFAPLAAPPGLQAAMDGSTLTATWGAPADALGLTGYVVHAERTSDHVARTWPTDPDETLLRVADLEPGLYRVRVDARSSTGPGVVSDPVLIRVPEPPTDPVALGGPATQPAPAAPATTVVEALAPTRVGPLRATSATTQPDRQTRAALVGGRRLTVTVRAEQDGWVTLRLRHLDRRSEQAVTLAQLTAWVGAGRPTRLALTLGPRARTALGTQALNGFSVLTTFHSAQGGPPLRTTARLR